MSSYKPVPKAEFDAVVAHVQHYYVDAITQAHPERLAQGAHADARIQGADLDELFAPFLAGTGNHPDWQSRLDVLAITPTTAVVRVEYEWGTAPSLQGYTDFVSLVKFDQGGWKIVNKVFHGYLEQQQ